MRYDHCQVLNLTIRRSRAKEIASNISLLEDWISLMGLPEGIRAHFTPVKDLLTWLQVCRFCLLLGWGLTHTLDFIGH